jgi:hypothetical protein
LQQQLKRCDFYPPLDDQRRRPLATITRRAFNLTEKELN